MKRVLMTGAAGGVGTMLTPLLRSIYPQLRLSDIQLIDGGAFLNGALDLVRTHQQLVDSHPSLESGIAAVRAALGFV